MEAALKGARELASPIIAMTITLMAVYAPIAFKGGLTGTLFTEFAFTLAGCGAHFRRRGADALADDVLALLKAETARKGFAHFLEQQFRALQGTSTSAYCTARSITGRSVTCLPLAILASCSSSSATSQQELAPTEDQGILLIHGHGGSRTRPLIRPPCSPKRSTRILQRLPGNGEHLPGQRRAPAGGLHAQHRVCRHGVQTLERTRAHRRCSCSPSCSSKINGIAGLKTVAFSRPSLPGAGRDCRCNSSSGPPIRRPQINQVAQELVGARVEERLVRLCRFRPEIRPAASHHRHRPRSGGRSGPRHAANSAPTSPRCWVAIMSTGSASRAAATR